MRTWSRASALVLVALWAAVSGAAGLPAALAQKLDPRLLEAVLSLPREPVTVWVEFRDKGERGAADVASALDRAAAALSPRARARRRRAGVWPLVDYRDVPVSATYLEALAAQGLKPIAVSRWLNRAAVRLPGANLAELAERPFVQRIVPVEKAMRSRDVRLEPESPTGGHGGASEWPDITHRRAAPGTPVRPRPHGRSALETPIDYGRTFDQLAQVNLPAVHACGYTGAGVLVCLLDDGFTYHDRHEALRDRIIQPGRTRDFVDGDTLVTDTLRSGLRHGTLVMGCIAGDKFGAYVGSAFGAEFALARTENDFSERPVEMLYWGMGAEWADSLGADIISSSLGYFTFDSSRYNYTYADMDGHTTDVTRAAEIAASKGILVVNAVGNEGGSPWRHLIAPADADSIVAVGAVNAVGDTASFSSAGPSAGPDRRIKPDVVARGVSNPVVAVSGEPFSYSINSGTSFATPIVAGLVACLMQADASWTAQQIIQAVRSTASRASGPDNKMGYGIPDALAALQWLLGGSGGRPRANGFLALSFTGSNPLRSTDPPAVIHFELGERSDSPVEARLGVMDAQGRTIRDLWSGELCFGQEQSIGWDGRDDDGDTIAPGVYWIALRGNGRVKAVRIVSLQ